MRSENFSSNNTANVSLYSLGFVCLPWREFDLIEPDGNERVGLLWLQSMRGP
jgi:hypothetical protein